MRKIDFFKVRHQKIKLSNVHFDFSYKKFTRGKDVNKYSTKDLANIFGKKDLSEKFDVPVTAKEEVKQEGEASDPVGTNDSLHGVVTVKGGCIADYFKNKMAQLGRKGMNAETSDVRNEPESEDEKYVGFGFAGSSAEADKPSMKVEKNAFENEAQKTETPKKKSLTPGKRKSDFVFENPALDLDDSPQEMERTPKRRKSEFVYENGGLDLGSTNADEKTPSCMKKLETCEGSTKNEEFLNAECAESASKKKRRKKSKEVTGVVEGFVNEAMNLETRDSAEESATVSQFEIQRPHVGLANDALDLTDESSGKKRVTFNETVEYDTNVGKARGKKRKNKIAGKLDKFEVDNEKLKKKRKKEKSSDAVAIESAFINEGMDMEVLSQEATDNAVNERKMERARRKRRISNLETIEETPEEDKEESAAVASEIVILDDSFVDEAAANFEIVCLATPKDKKKKKRKSKTDEKTMKEQESSSHSVDENPNDVQFIEEIETIKTAEEKKSKKQKQHGEIEDQESIEIVAMVHAEDSGKKKKKRKKESINNEAYVIEVIEESNGTPKHLPPFEEDPKAEKTKKKNKEKPKKSIDKENVEVVSENTEIPESEKKRKKKKKIISSENEDTEPKVLSTDENLLEDGSNFQDKSLKTATENEVRSPWDSRGKASKKIFKTLFMRSPVVHFAGSNINEIKGYGVDFY